MRTAFGSFRPTWFGSIRRLIIFRTIHNWTGRYNAKVRQNARDSSDKVPLRGGGNAYVFQPSQPAVIRSTKQFLPCGGRAVIYPHEFTRSVHRLEPDRGGRVGARPVLARTFWRRAHNSFRPQIAIAPGPQYRRRHGGKISNWEKTIDLAGELKRSPIMAAMF